MQICPQCRKRTEEKICPHDGYSTVDEKRFSSDRKDPLVGKVFEGRYRIEEMIGRGGFGAVYRAVQLRMGERTVAIKVLRPELAENLEQVGRFQREANAISQLKHPNTIRVFDFGQTEAGALFMVTEHLQGVSLDVAMKKGPMSPERVAHIGSQVLKSLAEAHEVGIVHRDIKPENIFIPEVRGETDFVKVLDFGIAKVAASSATMDALTKTGVVVGTPAYMSPEQARGREIDPTTDLYSLGVVLYEMLTGRLPYQADTPLDQLMMHITEPVPPVPDHVDAPDSLKQAICACLSKNPAERPQSADDLRALLDVSIPFRTPSGTITPVASVDDEGGEIHEDPTAEYQAHEKSALVKDVTTGPGAAAALSRRRAEKAGSRAGAEKAGVSSKGRWVVLFVALALAAGLIWYAMHNRPSDKTKPVVGPSAVTRRAIDPGSRQPRRSWLAQVHTHFAAINFANAPDFPLKDLWLTKALGGDLRTLTKSWGRPKSDFPDCKLDVIVDVHPFFVSCSLKKKAAFNRKELERYGVPPKKQKSLLKSAKRYMKRQFLDGKLMGVYLGVHKLVDGGLKSWIETQLKKVPKTQGKDPIDIKWSRWNVGSLAVVWRHDRGGRVGLLLADAAQYDALRLRYMDGKAGKAERLNSQAYHDLIRPAPNYMKVYQRLVQATQLVPNYGDALVNLCGLHYMKGDFTDALKMCNTAEKRTVMVRIRAEAQVYRGCMAAIDGKKAKALAHFETALKLARSVGRTNSQVYKKAKLRKAALRGRMRMHDLKRLYRKVQCQLMSGETARANRTVREFAFKSVAALKAKVVVAFPEAAKKIVARAKRRCAR